MDRAALDFALHHKIPCGGWCPKGRRAEDGMIPERYPLQETKSPDYEVRTKLNVDQSEGTLIITLGQMDSGTLLTHDYATSTDKPCLVIDANGQEYSKVYQWLRLNGVNVLNTAGPRESNAPGIYQSAYQILTRVLGN